MSSPSLPPPASRSSSHSKGSTSLSSDRSSRPADASDLGRPNATGAPDDNTPVSAESPNGSSLLARLRARPALSVLGLALIALVGGAVVVATRPDAEPPAPQPDIALDVWAPYWALDDSLPEFDRRVRSMRSVSPFWFNATGVSDITIDPNALDEGLDEFLDIARGADVRVVPSIVDATPAGTMAAILADPVSRAQHVATIREFAAEANYDGIDLDYEQFAFADGRSTWAATRPNWVAFITELSAGLHSDGRTLTVSIPPVYDAGQTADSGFWVYDYGSIAPLVDEIRIMAYDFSVDEAGPIAPLAFVQRAIDGAIEASGAPDKLVLGLAAYGRNWPDGTRGTCPATGLQGRTTVTARTVDDLVALRGATPIQLADIGEWTFDYELEVTDGVTTCVQGRRVFYVDGDGVRARMDLARESGLGGVALWALGFEDQDVWDAILPTVDVTDQPDGAAD